MSLSTLGLHALWVLGFCAHIDLRPYALIDLEPLTALWVSTFMPISTLCLCVFVGLELFCGLDEFKVLS